jgi:hypothetical protein
MRVRPKIVALSMRVLLVSKVPCKQTLQQYYFKPMLVCIHRLQKHSSFHSKEKNTLVWVTIMKNHFVAGRGLESLGSQYYLTYKNCILNFVV